MESPIISAKVHFFMYTQYTNKDRSPKFLFLSTCSYSIKTLSLFNNSICFGVGKSFFSLFHSLKTFFSLSQNTQQFHNTYIIGSTILFFSFLSLIYFFLSIFLYFSQYKPQIKIPFNIFQNNPTTFFQI